MESEKRGHERAKPLRERKRVWMPLRSGGWSTSGCKYLKDLKGLLGAEIIRVVPSTRGNSLSE